MGLLFLLALLICLTVVPVMVGARIVGAQNTGFGTALFAVVVLVALSTGIDMAFGEHVIGDIVAAIAGGIILAGILGTSFWRALAVSVLVVVMQLIVFLVAAAGFFGVAALAA